MLNSLKQATTQGNILMSLKLPERAESSLDGWMAGWWPWVILWTGSQVADVMVTAGGSFGTPLGYEGLGGRVGGVGGVGGEGKVGVCTLAGHHMDH